MQVHFVNMKDVVVRPNQERYQENSAKAQIKQLQSAQFNSSLTEAHLTAVKPLSKCLKGFPDYICNAKPEIKTSARG